MPNLKEVRSRISSTISTQQITKAMKLVSATKLRKAQGKIIQMRPYEHALTGILQNLADSVDDERLKVFFDKGKSDKILIMAISSDRGLCGAFNANIVKKVNSLIQGPYKEAYNAGNIELLVLGKKANDSFKKDPKLTVNTKYISVFQDLNSEDAFKIAEEVLNEFLSGNYQAVEVVYNQFKNAATQIISHEAFLPVKLAINTSESKTNNDYIFEPGKVEILHELIPRSLKTRFYRFLLDSFASEHGARMIAMDKATDNAGELLKNLKLVYNQARQAAITREISEIVGGAAALEE
jgi:F-type H+-transporting ATPase subunit gamma